MGDLVNLRRERKRKMRNDEAKAAAERRVAFGVSKNEIQAAKARLDHAERSLDAHRLDGKPPRPGDDA